MIVPDVRVAGGLRHRRPRSLYPFDELSRQLNRVGDRLTPTTTEHAAGVECRTHVIDRPVVALGDDRTVEFMGQAMNEGDIRLAATCLSDAAGDR